MLKRLRMALADDRRARFQALALPHLDKLAGLAVRYADADSESEDLVQEAYLRAWSAFDQLREPAAVFNWLCRILRTVASERRRGVARRRKLVAISQLEAAHEEMVNIDAVSPLDQLAARMESDKLREALRSIPEEFAEAVGLHDVHGLRYMDIAQITSVPLGTVMSRISRGRRLLAGLLAGTNNNPSVRDRVAVRRKSEPPFVSPQGN